MGSDTGLEGRELGVSWSRLREHAECKKHAALKAQGKGARRDIRVFFPGTVADRCMRQWLSALPAPPPGGLAVLAAAILEAEEQTAKDTDDGYVRWRHEDDKTEVLAKVTRCLEQLESLLAEYVLPYQYEPAWRFRVPLILPYLDGTPQRIWLAGEMDIYTRHEPGRPRAVLDLKMTEDPDYWRKNVGQLLFYDLVVALTEGAYSEYCALLQPLCQVQVVPFVFSEDDRRELLSSISRYCNDVWQKVETLTEDVKQCGWCDTRHACPRYCHPSGRVPWPTV